MPAPPLDLLSEGLRRRSTALNRQDCRTAGEFVLYWLRTSARAHENPALDAAIELSDSLGIPLFVYHALSERYPFASDRHHRFILEGARDVQAEFAERGIPYAFHLERPGARGDHLLTLARRAAAVVTESFPWTPIRRWTRRVAQEAGVGMIGVDAACLVPMPLVPAKARERAFRFRKATEQLRAEALAARPQDPVPTVASECPELPFPPLDLQSTDLAELVAQCEIDHLVGPVDHTPGGSRAGYARWQAFRDGGLRRYDKRRNDALDAGVSRLSPYLHYGMVSPFRIAREADAIGGSGAEKFLDELLIWREMSWAWAFHNKVHDSVEALPAWARETLAAHERDARETLHDWETLARGCTGDALWDAAQRSLLVHGELHNNVRMTWGKMLPLWTPDAATALARLIDLNHRYALDGRDPNSYGGLLWCLGGFDRPFDPPRPVLGTVRPRDTHTHARRLDVTAYAARTTRPARSTPPRVAVVGAGVAGLVAGRALADHGWPVTLFDKGRVPGGRLAMRTSRETPGLRFDHGAAAFGASDPRFLHYVEAWRERGLVTTSDDGRFVPVEGARALARHLAADLELHCGDAVTALERTDDRWTLEFADGATAGPFEALVLTAPPPQSAALLRSAGLDATAETLAARSMTPCWTLMATAPGTGPWIKRPDHADVDLLLRGDAHPGKPAPGCVTVQASAAFTERHLEASPEEVAIALAPVLGEQLDIPIDPATLRAHRWRFARATDVGQLRSWYGEHGLALAGDWTGEGPACEADGGPGVQAAFLSGAAAAGRLLGSPLCGPARTEEAAPLAQSDLFAS
ncbi:MAG: deoxyribodipyrimidine photo-lyase [Pseudomonadales bacterium]|nr:deoxyribodipyrimidine photo-lyase [Pseudomonadales bacterium]